MIILQPWVLTILADPITKSSCTPDIFGVSRGVIDARVFLKNTYGYNDWEQGQIHYESEYGQKDLMSSDTYLSEIESTRPIYEHYQMSGRILDCGGGAGTVREFLPDNAEFISVDPWLDAPFSNSMARKRAYSCLNNPLNFIGATAEFLPFLSGSFDWVHMRSMLDHVQVVDLAILEAFRVLRPGGKLMVGLYVEGGRSGVVCITHRLKEFVKGFLGALGIKRWHDHHIWHPTYQGLIKLISDNGFIPSETYWQPIHKDMVCYVCASKPK